MTTPTVSATREGNAIRIAASAYCNTGGYSFSLKTRREWSYLTLTVIFNTPQRGSMVTQAFTTPTLDETVPIPEGVTTIDVIFKGETVATFTK